MIQAAHGLFLERGYEATTMQDVADAAGVAVQTMYYTFKTKAQLLAEVESFALLGDRPPGEWGDTALGLRLRNATTVSELVKAFVDVDSQMKARLAPFVAAVGQALPSDPEAVAQRESGRQEFFGFFIDRLAGLKGLRPGITTKHALDILMVINSLPAFIELTTKRDWTLQQWQSWLTSTIETQFLRPPAR